MKLASIKRYFLNSIKQSKATVAQPSEMTLQIANLKLMVDGNDGGGLQYSARSSFEEAASCLYPEIERTLSPKLVVDVGANYGFTGLVFATHFPGAKILLIEPSPVLCSFIKRNFKLNGYEEFEVIQAICGADDRADSTFALHPTNSQDNRVQGEAQWKICPTRTVSLSNMLRENQRPDNVFLKFDTQGYELHVFKGAEGFLLNHNNWLIKTEFAPYWLKSQNTNPAELLAYLIANFSVVEAPARMPFKSTLPSLFASELKRDDVQNFVSHITALNASDQGWCDLLVAPKSAEWIRQAHP